MGSLGQAQTSLRTRLGFSGQAAKLRHYTAEGLESKGNKPRAVRGGCEKEAATGARLSRSAPVLDSCVPGPPLILGSGGSDGRGL